MEVDNKDTQENSGSAYKDGDEKKNILNQKQDIISLTDSKPINFTNYSNGSAGNLGQFYLGSSSKLDNFLTGLGDISSTNTLHSNAYKFLGHKSNDGSASSNSESKPLSKDNKSQVNPDLEKVGNYNSSVLEWASSKIKSSSSDSFKFSGPKSTSPGSEGPSFSGPKINSSNSESSNFSGSPKASSASSDANNTYNTTAKKVESYVILDLIQQFNQLSLDFNNNKKSMLESKKRLGAVVSKVSTLTNKTESFDTSLKDAEDKLSTKVADFEKEIVTARNSLISVIALFASFFTFISISVNIFSRDMSLSTSISVLLVIWCCLISFIFVFMAGINKGGAFFTSMTFFKHAVCMVIMFICAFTLPKAIFYFLPVQWFP